MLATHPSMLWLYPMRRDCPGGHPAGVCETGAPRPRLLDRVRHAIRARHYSPRTEQAYVHWIRRYILFHGKRQPAEMAAAEVTTFLTALAVEGRVAASTQNQALSALLFLYRDVLAIDLPWLDGVVRAKRPARLPLVLTGAEVRALLQRLDGAPRLMAWLLYGAGLRVLECCRLRVQDVDLASSQITVRAGKGDRDRVTMVPAALRRKYPNAGRGWVGQTHPPPVVRQAPAGGRPRHPHRAGAAELPRRDHDPDLHARPEPRPGRSRQPGGQAVALRGFAGDTRRNRPQDRCSISRRDRTELCAGRC
jgi:hypothetical protein